MDFQKEFQTSATQEQSDATRMMNYLKDKYQNIRFHFISFDHSYQIGKYGAAQTGMNNVAISPELLEKMATDEEVRKQVENVLDHMSNYQNSAKAEAFLRDKELVSMGLVLDEDAQVSMWSATKERDKESIYPKYWRDEKSTSFYETHQKKKSSTNSYNYSHTSNMLRLANAKNVPAVRGLIAAKYGEIQKVKMQVTDSTEAAAIVRKIRSVIQNGTIKIARLHKEENLERLKKSAEKKMKEKLAKQLAEELRRKRTARRGLEQSQTAHLDDVMPKSGMSEEQFRQIAEQYVQAMMPDLAGGGVDISVDGASAAGSVDVTVVSAPVVTVDCAV